MEKAVFEACVEGADFIHAFAFSVFLCLFCFVAVFLSIGSTDSVVTVDIVVVVVVEVMML